MSALEVSVSRYSLTVDTFQTFESLSDVAENESGNRLRAALEAAVCATAAYVAPADCVISVGDMCSDPPDLPYVAGATTSNVLAALESAGKLTARTEFVEQSSDTYLSEGRTVTIVHVLQPFTIVTAEHGLSREANIDQSEVVPVGWYLVGETNECHRAPELVCVVGMNELSDDVVAWLYELDGFAATTCLAGCSTCGNQWCAESGSWTFQPDGCDAKPWAFDDAEDFRKNMIACPACSTGRVGFVVC